MNKYLVNFCLRLNNESKFSFGNIGIIAESKEKAEFLVSTYLKAYHSDQISQLNIGVYDMDDVHFVTADDLREARVKFYRRSHDQSVVITEEDINYED